MFIFSLLQFRPFPFRLQRLKPWRSCSCVFAFTLSLYTDNFCDLPHPHSHPPPTFSLPAPASQSLAMLASFWTLFTVDFLHNFAAWLPVSGPRQFCSFCLPFLTFPPPIYLIYMWVCVCVLLAFGEYVVARAACNLLKTIQMTKSTRQATFSTSGHSLLVAWHNASSCRLHYQVG